LNPTLALQLWIWNLGAYNYPLTNAVDSVSFYSANRLGRYVWVYVGSATFAGFLAGFAAKFYIESKEGNEGANKKRQKSETVLEQAMRHDSGDGMTQSKKSKKPQYEDYSPPGMTDSRRDTRRKSTDTEM